MKHLILVKFKEEVSDKIIDDINALFKKALQIEGIYDIQIYKNIIELPNRYDLMIEIEMEKEVLLLFDSSEVHSIWKKKYSFYIQSKIIFDY